MPAYWPGISSGVLGCNYTNSHGVMPGCATLELHPSVVSRAEKHGDLMMTDDAPGSVPVQVIGMVYDGGSATAGGGASRAPIRLLDRRWLWQIVLISGRYNDPDDFDPPFQGTSIDPDNKKKKCVKLYDLLHNILRFIGEQPILEGIPDVKPLVNWDHRPAAACLSELTDQYGLRVCPRTDKRETKICKAGEGGPLPPGHQSNRAIGFDPPEPPEKLVCYGAPAEYQCRIALEAVGEDFDGSIKPIKELSYRPTNDKEWRQHWPSDYANLVAVGEHTVEEAIALAHQCIWKYYRPKRTGWYDDFDLKGGLCRVDGYKEKGGKGASGSGQKRDPKATSHYIDARRVILTDRKCEETKPDDLGNVKRKPAEFVGHWLAVNEAGQTDKDDKRLHRIPWQLDASRNLVIFDQAMVKIDWETDPEFPGYAQADVWIECAVLIRDKDTNQFERYEREKKMGGPRETKRAVTRGDVYFKRVAQYKEGGDPDAYEDYLDTKDTGKADYYLEALAAEYEVKQTDSASYNGLRGDIQLDGAIGQVTHSVAPGRTQASLNSEHSRHFPDYPTRKHTAEFTLETQRKQAIEAAASRDVARKNGIIK